MGLMVCLFLEGMREGFGWGDVVEGKSGQFRVESEADALGHGDRYIGGGIWAARDPKVTVVET